MNGREKIEGAFSREGTRETPAVICYWDIYVRDHWSALTARPWWQPWRPEIESQVEWYRDIVAKTGQDWFYLPQGYSAEEREQLAVEERPGGVFLVDRGSGRETRIEEPEIGGGHWKQPPPPRPQTFEEIDRAAPLPEPFDPEQMRREGRCDLAGRLLKEFGGDHFPINNINSPVWGGYSLWEFEEFMTYIATRPELIQYASERFLAQRIRSVREIAALGAGAVWIDECLMDQISPAQYEALVVPVLHRLMEEIRAAGMKSIYYFCGNPAGKWEQILSIGADALALEEGKKGFQIDIAEVAKIVRGRCTILGNLDAVGILQDGTEGQLRAEISRQIQAGRENGGRFIMSLGSPVTPATPVERVRRYTDLVHELGGAS